MIKESGLGLGIIRPKFLGLGQSTGMLRAVIASMSGASRDCLLSCLVTIDHASCFSRERVGYST